MKTQEKVNFKTKTNFRERNTEMLVLDSKSKKSIIGGTRRLWFP